ncbi:MAG: NAD(+)/NADH kinase, partial [Spirochaetales bacterium]|nr:NAD(+)/NADH kinase [Spirochaetales bacterium]
MKIGVMFNPGAGGIGKYSGIGKIIEDVFFRDDLITGNSLFGSDYVSALEVVGDQLVEDFQKNMDNILKPFVEKRVDMIIGVGGDGFLTHIAAFLIRQDVNIPLMGVAGGTANIGPLIKYNQDTLKHFTSRDMVLEKVGCIEVATGGSILGYAFCDVVLGDTFLGTKDNRMCNFSTKSFLQTGGKVEIKPGEQITGKRFSIYKNSNKQIVKSKKIAQIIAAPIYHKEFYRGKAITGALCYSLYNNYGASIGISDS